MSPLSWCACGTKDKYVTKEDIPESSMNFRHVAEPHLSELGNYLRQRHEHVVVYASTADIRAEVTRNVTERTQPIDQYPKGRQFLGDEDYLTILRDLLNLSNILDDMEQTGWVAYQNRSAYYNQYSRLYRMLMARATGKS
mmetsp:Transcript_1813/g.4803  ORF Transcript_1813/g.4803 Transcript_1813/m.4803 type:complete len:140 (-) Transcript_1813:525-944(-)